MSSNFTAFFIALIALMLSLSVVVQSASIENRILGSRLLKKASKPVEWDDLGYAWGKRSGPPEVDTVPLDQQISLQRYVRALKAAKKTNDWDDLGFAWGKK